MRNRTPHNRTPQARRPRTRRGSVLVYCLVAVVAMAAVISLAIDSAHVRTVKTQLQCAADAAARVGAQTLQSGTTAAQNAAIAAAAANYADGSAVVVTAGTDIDFGTWANGSFTILSGGAQSSANAVRVRCSRTAAKGNAVRAIFGAFMGISSCDVTAQSTATGTATFMAGFIGYAGITMKNNAYFGGYKSSVTTTPTETSAGSKMRVGSNSVIDGKNNDEIHGDVVLGPGASISGPTVTGSTLTQSSPIPTPTLPTWAPTGGTASALVVSSTTTLPGGSYWYSSMTLSANLTFSGPTILYVNGPISIGGTMAAATKIPADLVIYQYGSTTFGDGASNGMNITAVIEAPGSDFTAKNNLYYAGSGIFNTITTKNNADFFYDEQHGPSNGSNAVVTVQ